MHHIKDFVHRFPLILLLTTVNPVFHYLHKMFIHKHNLYKRSLCFVYINIYKPIYRSSQVWITPYIWMSNLLLSTTAESINAGSSLVQKGRSTFGMLLIPSWTLFHRSIQWMSFILTDSAFCIHTILEHITSVGK